MGLLIRGYFEDEFWKIDAKVRIGNRTYEKVKFIIDTGSGSTILSLETARRIGINLKDISNVRERTIYGAGKCNTKDLMDTSIIFDIDQDSENLLVGCPKISIPDPDVYKLDVNLIGQDILKNFNITINNKKKKIMLIYSENLCITISHE